MNVNIDLIGLSLRDCAVTRTYSALSSQHGRRLRVVIVIRKQQASEGAHMNERLETLKKARERMIEDRDAHAKVLAAPFDRDKAERARSKFTEIQALIDALDRAISGEEAISPKS